MTTRQDGPRERYALSYVEGRRIPCRECAAIFEAGSSSADFCSVKCRNDYNNRRARRGMLLYDFFMQMRYRRSGAKGLWSAMCRLAEEWHDEDKQKRHGFQSWRDPGAHLERNPYLKAKKGRI